MWEVKTFKTKEAMDRFIVKNKNKLQIDRIFVGNTPYAIEYRKLHKVY
jgi:hypothetical protein